MLHHFVAVVEVHLPLGNLERLIVENEITSIDSDDSLEEKAELFVELGFVELRLLHKGNQVVVVLVEDFESAADEGSEWVWFGFLAQNFLDQFGLVFVFGLVGNEIVNVHFVGDHFFIFFQTIEAEKLEQLSNYQ